MNKIFTYNPILAKEGSKLIKKSMAQQSPIEALKTFTAENSNLLTEKKHELFFYGLIAMRRHFPQLFLPPDLTLLAANVAHDIEKNRIALLDWELLPSAILLSMSGIKIAFPDNKISLPIPTFTIIDGETSLGWNLEAHFNKNTNFQKTLGEAAIFLSPRDFLTSIKAARFKETLIKNNLLERILQLPKPKRQNFNIYPILTIIGRTDEEPFFNKIETCEPGPGGLDQQKCLETLKEKTTYYIETPQPSGKISLRKIAEVFRCQFPRKKTTEKENQQPDTIIAREIALGDANPTTGLIEKEPQSFSLINVADIGYEKKYFLEKNDILMVFRGAQQTLGKTTFYQLDETAIPNRAFCVIRTKHGINPIWLFYALQQTEIIDEIRKNGSGKDTLIVSLNAIRDIELTLPTTEFEKEIIEKHGKILEKTHQIEQIENEIKCTLNEIQKLFN